MSRSQEKDLDVLIRARYPLVYLVTWEENRVDGLLSKVGHAQGKTVVTWSLTRGMTSPPGGADPETRDPKKALEFISKSDQRALFVLKDFHPHLQDPTVIRLLRDLVQDLKSSYKTVLILSPVLSIPPELEKDVTVVDYDLPGPSEMGVLVDDIIAASRKNGSFKVQLQPGDREKIIQAALGLTLSEAENALARAIVNHSELNVDQVEDVILEEMKQIVRKSRMLEYYEAREEFGQIGGLDYLKAWLTKRGSAFSEKAREFGLPEPKGILLLGVQGCGKSMTCKAISGLWRLPLLRLDMGSIFGGFVGQSEENMRRAIKTAESIAPCILWLDEIEKGLSGTQSSNFSDAGTTARVFSTFLTWLQEKSKPVFVAATANNIQMLPPELLRKGRLDEIFFIDLPLIGDRKQIFNIHIAKKKRDPAVFNLDSLATLTHGFSGAEIEQAVISALYEAFSAGRDLAQEDLESAVRSTVPLSTTMEQEIQSLRNWAESRTRPASPPSSDVGAPRDIVRRMEVPT